MHSQQMGYLMCIHSTPRALEAHGFGLEVRASCTACVEVVTDMFMELRGYQVCTRAGNQKHAYIHDGYGFAWDQQTTATVLPPHKSAHPAGYAPGHTLTYVQYISRPGGIMVRLSP